MATFSEILDQIRMDLRKLTERQTGALARPLIQNFMLTIYRLGTAIEQDPALRNRPELAALFQELEPGIRDNRVFLVSYPQEVVGQYQTTWDGGEWMS